MRPVCIIDTETNKMPYSNKWNYDTNNECYVIQIACIRVDVDANKMIGKLATYLKPTGPYEIEYGAYKAHGITPQMLEGAPTFPEVSGKLLELIKDSDLCFYNALFDIPMLRIEFERMGVEWNVLDEGHVIYDPLEEERKRCSWRLNGVFEKYMGKTMEEYGLPPHDALSDVKATYAVFKKQLETGGCAESSIASECGNLVYTEQEDGRKEITAQFGRMRGIPLLEAAVASPSWWQWFYNRENTYSPRAKQMLRNVYNNYNKLKEEYRLKTIKENEQ